MGAGKVEVTVPWDANVEASAEVGAGSFDLFGNRQTGVNLDGKSRSTGQPGAPAPGRHRPGRRRRGHRPPGLRTLHPAGVANRPARPDAVHVAGSPYYSDAAGPLRCSAADGVTQTPALACVVAEYGAALCRPPGEAEPAVDFADDPGTRRCQVPAGGGEATCGPPDPRHRPESGPGHLHLHDPRRRRPGHLPPVRRRPSPPATRPRHGPARPSPPAPPTRRHRPTPDVHSDHDGHRPAAGRPRRVPLHRPQGRRPRHLPARLTGRAFRSGSTSRKGTIRPALRIAAGQVRRWTIRPSTTVRSDLAGAVVGEEDQVGVGAGGEAALGGEAQGVGGVAGGGPGQVGPAPAGGGGEVAQGDVEGEDAAGQAAVGQADGPAAVLRHPAAEVDVALGQARRPGRRR